MPVSFAQAQANLLADNFLDTLGTTRGPDEVQLNRTSAAIVRLAGDFVADVTQNIQRKDLVSSGQLESSVRPEIVELGANNIIDIKVAEYYKYVDKGVKGWKNKKGPGNTPYAFNRPTPGVKGGSSAFVASLQKWLQFAKGGAANVKVPVTPREGKRVGIRDASLSRAIAVAGIVRRDGLRGSNFWTDAVRKLENNIAAGVADALRIDVTEQIVP